MIKTKEMYIEQLKRATRSHPDGDAIVAELMVHIEEKLASLEEGGLCEAEAVQIVLEQFGHPNDLAAQFGVVSTQSPAKAKLMFVLGNSLFFLLGACITLGYRLADVSIFHFVWEVLAHNSWLILLGYTGYWALIGFHIGKQFGVKGKRLLSETVKLAIVPNLMLMLAVLYGFFPVEWFSPLLTTSFVGGCLGATALFYPFSKIGYYFGMNRTV